MSAFNIAGVGILLSLVVEFLVLIVISEQLVDVRHHVVGVVEDAIEQVLD